MDYSPQNLESLGMTPKEARVYLALLELGQCTVSAIAERAEINRSTTYVILRGLRAQGYVLEIPNTKKHQFVAEDPHKLLERARERMTLAERIVPSLQAKQKKESGLANIRFYQGITGLREAYTYKLSALAGSECVAFWGGTPKLSEEAHRVFLKWYRDSKRAGVRFRAIAPKDENLSRYRAEDEEHSREVRLVERSIYPSEL